MNYLTNGLLAVSYVYFHEDTLKSLLEEIRLGELEGYSLLSQPINWQHMAQRTDFDSLTWELFSPLYSEK